MLSRHDRETRAAILRAHHKMIGAEAKRDAVERQMQTFNAVVQERDAKIVEATERAERTESALAAAEGRERALRELLRRVLHATSANMSMDMYAEVCRAIDSAALARKEGE